MDRHREQEAQRRASGEPAVRLGLSPGFRELKWLKPAYVGDTITYASEVLAKRVSKSRPGWGLVTVRYSGSNETGEIVRGLGTLYTWNVVSPRLGVTAKLTADGLTMLRASYGRFSQGVLTGETGLFHPAVTPVTTEGLRGRNGRLHARRASC